MLEVGCRKGKHTLLLAETGLDVTGIDTSFHAINEAKAAESEHVHFFQHDIRLPFWMQYFNYAFNFFTNFGYFRTVRDHENAIRTIARSLKLNGQFVMDYLNVHYDEDHLKKSYNKKVGEVRFRISRWHDPEHFFKQIQIEEKGVTKHLYTEKVAKFTLGDFTDMFAYQGLQIQEVFGDYKLGEYHITRSQRLIMVAKKIRN
jgi:SAM-dependent methyltransferase